MKETIKRYRREKQMTQKQLADKLGVSLSAVGMWELGLRTPVARMLPALAAALGCSIDELFADAQHLQEPGTDPAAGAGADTGGESVAGA